MTQASFAFFLLLLASSCVTAFDTFARQGVGRTQCSQVGMCGIRTDSPMCCGQAWQHKFGEGLPDPTGSSFYNNDNDAQAGPTGCSFSPSQNPEIMPHVYFNPGDGSANSERDLICAPANDACVDMTTCVTASPPPPPLSPSPPSPLSPPSPTPPTPQMSDSEQVVLLIAKIVIAMLGLPVVCCCIIHFCLFATRKKDEKENEAAFATSSQQQQPLPSLNL